MKKRHAFTLAETLISIAILGVIALLFVIGINTDTHMEKLNTVSYDKVYNDIAQASKSVLTLDSKGHFTIDDDLREQFASRLDVDKTWENGSEWVNCAIVNDAAKDNGETCESMSGVTLTNGTNIGFASKKSSPNLNVGSGSGDNLVGAAFVDVNGKSSGNAAGDDQFVIPIYSNGVQETDTVAENERSFAAPTTSSTCTPCSQQSNSLKTCSGNCSSGCTCSCVDSAMFIGTGCVEYKHCLDGTPSIPANAVLNTKRDNCYDCKINSAACAAEGKKFNEISCECVNQCEYPQVADGDKCVCDSSKLATDCIQGKYNDFTCVCECPNNGTDVAG